MPASGQFDICPLMLGGEAFFMATISERNPVSWPVNGENHRVEFQTNLRAENGIRPERLLRRRLQDTANHHALQHGAARRAQFVQFRRAYLGLQE